MEQSEELEAVGVVDIAAARRRGSWSERMVLTVPVRDNQKISVYNEALMGGRLRPHSSGLVRRQSRSLSPAD